MMNLLAKCMFEATRISPLASSHKTNTAGNKERPCRSHSELAQKEKTNVHSTLNKMLEFSRLHHGEQVLLVPNAWDAGSARLLEGLGFSALATTSAGLAISKGLRDGSGLLSRRDIMENALAIVESTSLPVSADLENGFGDSPEDCAKTIHDACRIGLCGGSIEDATGDANRPIYPFEQAIERISAAAEAKTSEHFLLTARTENYLCGRPDLDDTIRRLKAFEAAGADVVYAPGLPDMASVRAVCRELTVPVNVLVGLTDAAYSVEDLSSAGVSRISTGGSLARAAMGEMLRAAQELKSYGTYGFAEWAISDKDVMSRMSFNGNTPDFD